jgi:hypothetical protein
MIQVTPYSPVARLIRPSRGVRRHTPDHDIDVKVAQFFNRFGVKVPKIGNLLLDQKKNGVAKTEFLKNSIWERPYLC